MTSEIIRNNSIGIDLKRYLAAIYIADENDPASRNKSVPYFSSKDGKSIPKVVKTYPSIKYFVYKMRFLLKGYRDDMQVTPYSSNC